MADTAASMVQVNYTNIQKPLTDVKEAVQAKSFFNNAPEATVKGNPDGKHGFIYKFLLNDMIINLFFFCLPYAT